MSSKIPVSFFTELSRANVTSEFEIQRRKNNKFGISGWKMANATTGNQNFVGTKGREYLKMKRILILRRLFTFFLDLTFDRSVFDLRCFQQ